jgi:hypothetical protein
VEHQSQSVARAADLGSAAQLILTGQWVQGLVRMGRSQDTRNVLDRGSGDSYAGHSPLIAFD